MVLQLPPVPPALRSIQHYLKAAAEHEYRDPVVAYWCRLFALQSAMRVDKKSDESKQLLIALMNWLESQKKALSDNEAITNEMAAQAHIENYALRLFQWADSQDRAAIFNKNVVKAFYTSALLMDVLTTFGELSEDIAGQSKYAKWKAAYIHNCLKNGETPVPGPAEDSEENFDSNSSSSNTIGFNIGSSSDSQTGTPPMPWGMGGGVPSVNDTPGGIQPPYPQGSSTNIPPLNPYSQPPQSQPPPPQHQSFTPQPPTSSYTPQINPPFSPQPPPSTFTPHQPATEHSVGGFEAKPSDQDLKSGVKLEPTQITKAQKYCKFAASALNYDDVTEAISNLQKALKLLTTGQDS